MERSKVTFTKPQNASVDRSESEPLNELILLHEIARRSETGLKREEAMSTLPNER